MSVTRVILHADLDAFFASVEQRDNPSWRGRPVLVGGSGPRAVVAAASYEARAYGCRSAMPMQAARRLCPQAIIAPVRMARYAEESRRFMAILGDHSPCVQALSVDEAFLDATGMERLLGSGEDIARSIRARVRAELGLTCSVGVAPTMLVAKLASDLRKPDGLMAIAAHEVMETLAPLPIDRMWGVGPVAAESFRARGIMTFGDLQRLSQADAAALLGEHGASAWEMARGIDERSVTPHRDRKSVGHEETFDADLPGIDAARAALLPLVEATGRRLRERGLAGRTVTVKLRTGDFTTITRRTTLDAPTGRTDALWQAARGLLERWCAGGYLPLRLVGVSVSGLVPDADAQALFHDPADERARRIDAARDAAARKFGEGAISSALGLGHGSGAGHGQGQPQSQPQSRVPGQGQAGARREPTDRAVLPSKEHGDDDPRDSARDAG